MDRSLDTYRFDVLRDRQIAKHAFEAKGMVRVAAGRAVAMNWMAEDSALVPTVVGPGVIVTVYLSGPSTKRRWIRKSCPAQVAYEGALRVDIGAHVARRAVRLIVIRPFTH